MSSLDDKPQKLTRRQALKALAAATGVVALVNIPEKWEPPIIESGLLPAHAQGSPTASTLAISSLRRVSTGINDCNTLIGPGSSFNVSFDYQDVTGNVTTSESTILYSGTITGIPDVIPLSSSFVQVSGDNYSGTVTFQLCTRFGNANSITDVVSLRNDNGVVSDQSSITTDKPVGAQGNDELGSQSLG